MAAAVRNTVFSLGLDIAEAVRMASEYPAEFLGLGHELRRIAPGYRANLVRAPPLASVAAPSTGNVTTSSPKFSTCSLVGGCH
jgi:N-acetylglucosamine-6-phosphate deacetylase